MQRANLLLGSLQLPAQAAQLLFEPQDHTHTDQHTDNRAHRQGQDNDHGKGNIVVAEIVVKRDRLGIEYREGQAKHDNNNQ